MEKRVLLAFVLSFAVLFGYQALFPPPKPQGPPSSTQPAAVPSPESPGSVGSVAAPPLPAAPAGAAPVVSDSADRDVVVETDVVTAVFGSRGAVLKSWKLKSSRDPQGQPLELLPSGLPAEAPKPFALTVVDAGVTARLQQALYRPSATTLRLQDAPLTLTFEYTDAAGLSVRKVFGFSPAEPYSVRFSASVTAGQEMVPVVEMGPALGTGLIASSMTYSPPPQAVFYRDGKVTRVAGADLAAQPVQEGVFAFAGVDDHYFLSAVLASAAALHLEFKEVKVPQPGSETAAQFVQWSARYPAAPVKERFFLGPKDFDVLRAIDPTLTYAIDFGMFRWFVVPLLNALKWVHGYVGNYGWSIILLTILINLAMFPLRHKSVVSMRRMQEIQPEVKAIQDRYSKLKMADPARQKMNAETMNLYRERGVNPASGCVPMLLTLPVLFAFYSMLSVAIELRGAPFVGWIRDLSVHDPLFITPVLMGITQFVQTKMTPTTADPMQQKMMLFMPLIMMTMFIWAPSGLVLYWTVSNVWTIGQQAVTNRLIGPTVARAVRPAVDRKVKSAGAGKSEQATKERK